MKDRRPLSEGLNPPAPPVDPEIARKFIHGEKPQAEGGEGRPSVEPATPTPTTPTINRIPFSTRIREDFSKALKRASLERQLKGLEPNSLQDILEEAVEPWLRKNGYIS
jgi:hypothetical protein